MVNALPAQATSTCLSFASVHALLGVQTLVVVLVSIYDEVQRALVQQ